jgi:catechol-2,3-dioxygenase
MNTITRAKICTANGCFFLHDPEGDGIELSFKDSPNVRIWDNGSIDYLEEIKEGNTQLLDEAVSVANRYLGF